jgi:hypothetical protein
MKTAELTGYVLDRAVMRCEGLSKWLHGRIKYSSDWAEAGPIIEREEISTSREFASGCIEWAAWTPSFIRDDADAFGYGPTPLIAAMRCYVASKLGDEIDVPVEWMEGK